MHEKETKSLEEKLKKKKAYQKKIEARLREWSAKIEELKAKADGSKAALQVKYKRQIEDLRNKEKSVQQKLQELIESGEEAWGDLKTGIEKSLDESKDSFDRTLSKFKEKGEETFETVSRQKKVYIRKMEAQLKVWGIEVEILRARAEKSKAKVKIKYLEQIKELRIKQEAVKRKLHEVQESGDEAWEDFKGGVEEALSEMRNAFRQAVSRFKKN